MTYKDKTPPMVEIPYPPVFKDWYSPERRVTTALSPGGVQVQMLMPGGGSTWMSVELTEDDACLFAASLLVRAGREKLSRRVLKALAKSRMKEEN